MRGYICINFEFAGEDDKDFPDDVITSDTSYLGLVPRVGDTVRLWSERDRHGNYQDGVPITARKPIRSAEGVVVSIEHDIEERGGSSADCETAHYVTVKLKRTRGKPPHRRRA